jgi:hypothetical protein
LTLWAAAIIAVDFRRLGVDLLEVEGVWVDDREAGGLAVGRDVSDSDIG